MKQCWKPEMRGFVWLEKEVKLEEAAAAAAGGQIFRIIMGQQGVSSTIPSPTRHHPLGCLRCTQDFKDCGPETFRLGLPKKHLWVMMTPSCSSHTIWCKSCSSTITPNLSMWVMQVMQANSIARISFSLMKWLLMELARRSVIPLPRSWPKYRILVSKGTAILTLRTFLLFRGIYHAWFRV